MGHLIAGGIWKAHGGNSARDVKVASVNRIEEYQTRPTKTTEQNVFRGSVVSDRPLELRFSS